MRQPETPAARPRLTRRRLLLGGLGGLGLLAAGGAGGYELVQQGVVPGKYALARFDGACGSGPPAAAGPRPGRHEVSFYSVYRHREVTMVTLVPAAASLRGLDVVLALHGTGGTAASLAGQLAPAMTAARVTGFAAVTVDGGDTYWHKRADGDDPIGMIQHEVLPRLAAAGLRTGRIGITGESMGGFGGLLLAERLAATRATWTSPAAVAALSPAIFASYADARAANRRSFDGQADFAANNVLTGVASLRAVPAWISCGTDDPFEAETTIIRDRLAALTGHQPAGGIRSGCHDDAFWNRNLPSALHFLAAHLHRKGNGG